MVPSAVSVDTGLHSIPVAGADCAEGADCTDGVDGADGADGANGTDGHGVDSTEVSVGDSGVWEA